MRPLAAVAAFALLTALPCAAKHSRSHSAKVQFARQHPCPATGKPTPHCPGYVIDHLQALCVGGDDAPHNMQWQTVADAKAKDRWECTPEWRQHAQPAE